MSPFHADNVLCAVTANESGHHLFLDLVFGDCNYRPVTHVTLCTFIKNKRAREKKYIKYMKADNQFHITNFYFRRLTQVAVFPLLV